MYFSVEIAFRSDRRLTTDDLMEVSALGGGFACGHAGRRRVETTLTIWAKDAPTAAGRAIERIRRRIPGRVLAVKVMTLWEADRQLRLKLKGCNKLL